MEVSTLKDYGEIMDIAKMYIRLSIFTSSYKLYENKEKEIRKLNALKT